MYLFKNREHFSLQARIASFQNTALTFLFAFLELRMRPLIASVFKGSFDSENSQQVSIPHPNLIFAC